MSSYNFNELELNVKIVNITSKTLCFESDRIVLDTKLDNAKNNSNVSSETIQGSEIWEFQVSMHDRTVFDEDFYMKLEYQSKESRKNISVVSKYHFKVCLILRFEIFTSDPSLFRYLASELRRKSNSRL